VGSFRKQKWGLTAAGAKRPRGARPWEDLRVLSETITTERFQLDIYFICTVIKP
jgi:hypothetical protein